ncbi:MAG: MarC family protein [Candidatus Micrarchaeia archaeon]
MAGMLEAFVLLLGIIDPLTSLAAFLSLTKGLPDNEKRRIAVKGVAVAALVFFVFAAGGERIMDALGVSIASFKAAGGIILILLGVQMSLGISFPKEKEGISEIAVVLATPLISGPATITTAMILAKENGLLVTAVAGAAALFVTFLALIFASAINRVLGKGGVQIMSTMMGIVTIAWGLQFVLSGINSFSV